MCRRLRGMSKAMRRSGSGHVDPADPKRKQFDYIKTTKDELLYFAVLAEVRSGFVPPGAGRFCDHHGSSRPGPGGHP